VFNLVAKLFMISKMKILPLSAQRHVVDAALPRQSATVYWFNPGQRSPQ
jgi:hypothetical protein